MSRLDIDDPNYNDTNLGDPRETAEEKEIARLEKRLTTLRAHADDLAAALERVVRAFEADAERVPELDVLTCWETNGAAVGQAREALEAYRGKP